MGQVLGRRRQPVRLVGAWRGPPAVQQRHHPDAAHAVGHAVVRLDDVHRTAVVEALDEHRHPRRPSLVERLGAQVPADAQRVVEVGRLRQPDAAQVIAEVELGVHRPHRVAEAERRLHRAHPDPGHDVRGPLVRPHQPVPVRRVIEEVDRDDGGAQPRLGLLHPPHAGLEVGHRPVPAVRDGGQVDVDRARWYLRNAVGHARTPSVVESSRGRRYRRRACGAPHSKCGPVGWGTHRVSGPRWPLVRVATR